MAERMSFTHLMSAVRQAAQLIQRAWIAAAQGADLRPDQQTAYIAGLLQAQSLQVSSRGGGITSIVQNLSANAQHIDNGTPAYHLPDVIDWAKAAGRGTAHKSGSGIYYLFVPFRHFAPRYASHGAIPAAVKRQMLREAVYRRAKRLQPGESLTAGPSTGRRLHAPGLSPYVPAYPRNIRPGYAHAAREEGLRRYKEQARGRGGGSSYLTFRTITSASTGWWIPARPGLHIAQTVQQETAGEVSALLEAGVRQEVTDTLRADLGGT